MYRMTDLPLDPEDWRGSDEWAALADARRHYNEQRIDALYELMFEEPAY